jgi:hypothetical protein
MDEEDWMMRRVMVCVSLAAGLAVGPAIALETDHGRVTAADLVSFCSVAEDDAAYNAAIAFCYGYLDAALDYHAVLTAGSKFDSLTCPPETTSRGAVTVAVIEWAGAHSDVVGDGAPVHVVMQAVAETWPCTAD